MDRYSTASNLLGTRPAWVRTTEDQNRLAAYALYEVIYWNVPDTFKLLQRGSDATPIYVPAGRKIVETLHRFMAPKMTVVADPQFGSEGEQQAAMLAITDLFRRERFYSRFSTNKREGIIKGDWLWHLYADPERPDGARISILPLDPATYFPIYNPENIDEVIGGHIVEEVTFGGKPHIRRLTYMKQTGVAGPSPIEVTDETYEVDKWDDPEAMPVNVVNPPYTLPAPIDQIPVYHVQNFHESGSIWGSSELRGMERLIAAINQSITDEELALALEGLGVYATDAGTPIDPETNEEIPWNIGPGRVVELPDGKKMSRVSGVSSVTPYQDHIAYLHSQLDGASATPAIAAGNVDVETAESGIALYLQLAPLLAKAEEKEQIVTDVHVNLFYDLRKWFQAYEPSLRGPMENVRWLPVYGEKVPTNRKQRFDEVMSLLERGVVSGQWARTELKKIGYEFPDDTTMMGQILEEKEMTAKVEADAFGARLDRELDSQDGEIQ